MAHGTITLIFLGGVPQGSILGPTVFLICVDDLTSTATYFSTRLFADATSLTARGRDLDSLLLQINDELPNIYDWLCGNRLTLNLDKTKYIISQSWQKLNSKVYPSLTFAGQLTLRSFILCKMPLLSYRLSFVLA